MPDVLKTSCLFRPVPLLLACLAVSVLTTGGCARTSLLRFTPPGLMKYEDIAGRNPPDPVMQERLELYYASANPVFPVLSQTPLAEGVPSASGSHERGPVENAAGIRKELGQHDVQPEDTFATEKFSPHRHSGI